MGLIQSQDIKKWGIISVIFMKAMHMYRFMFKEKSGKWISGILINGYAYGGRGYFRFTAILNMIWSIFKNYKVWKLV